MKLAAILILLTLAAGAEPASWDVGPLAGFKNHRLVLTPSQDSTLRQLHPTFRLWRLDEFLPEIQQHAKEVKQEPFAVVADFNGDGRADVAVHGRTDKHCLVAVILSRGRTYQVYEVSRVLYSKDVLYAGMTNGKKRWGVKTLLEPVKPGKHEFVEGPPLVLKLPAFEYSVFQTGALLYYWDGKTFKERNAGC